MVDEQKDATGITTVAPSYAEAVRGVVARGGNDEGPGHPVPDTPRGAPHLNPALTPAPARVETPARIPVPVINDPGLVGANPPLHLLNRAFRADVEGSVVNDEKGLPTEADSAASIREAALKTQDDIATRADDAAKDALGDVERTEAIETAAAKSDDAKASRAKASKAKADKAKS